MQHMVFEEMLMAERQKPLEDHSEAWNAKHKRLEALIEDARYVSAGTYKEPLKEFLREVQEFAELILPKRGI